MQTSHVTKTCMSIFFFLFQMEAKKSNAPENKTKTSYEQVNIDKTIHARQRMLTQVMHQQTRLRERLKKEKKARD